MSAILAHNSNRFSLTINIPLTDGSDVANSSRMCRHQSSAWKSRGDSDSRAQNLNIPVMFRIKDYAIIGKTTMMILLKCKCHQATRYPNLTSAGTFRT